MLAKTLFGFEDILANELTQLGALHVEKGVRNVSFVGDKGFMYKANLGLRTAIKILKPIHSFRVHKEEDLLVGLTILVRGAQNINNEGDNELEHAVSCPKNGSRTNQARTTEHQHAYIDNGKSH